MKFVKFLRTLSLQNTSGGCFCRPSPNIVFDYHHYKERKLEQDYAWSGPNHLCGHEFKLTFKILRMQFSCVVVMLKQQLIFFALPHV